VPVEGGKQLSQLKISNEKLSRGAVNKPKPASIEAQARILSAAYGILVN
jgi:hypothetical protein